MQGTVSSSFQRAFSWPSFLADLVLAGLVSGPLAAPFLAASGLPVLTTIAQIIYAMGDKVCPQPEMALALADPYQMSVCMRCYGTVMGLVAMRWFYHRDVGKSRYWLEQYGMKGFVATCVLCLFYPLELSLQGFSGWGMHHWVMTLFGLISGLGLGAYIMPMFHRRDSIRS